MSRYVKVVKLAKRGSVITWLLCLVDIDLYWKYEIVSAILEKKINILVRFRSLRHAITQKVT